MRSEQGSLASASAIKAEALLIGLGFVGILGDQ